MPVRSFYFREGGEVLFKKFKEISEREGRAMGQILEDLVREYVRIHEPGNPQKRLDVILKGEKGLIPRCSVCGDPAERVYHTRRGPILRCRRHRLGLMDPAGVRGWREV